MSEDSLKDKLEVRASLLVCEKCSGIMRYRGAGLHKCEECGYEVLDAYGKARQFLEKHGPCNIMEIAAGTGLSRSEVSELLKEGRLEVARSSKVQLYCKRCGMGIRSGEYCSRCEEEVKQLESRNKVKGIYNSLHDINSDKDKMRFLD